MKNKRPDEVCTKDPKPKSQIEYITFSAPAGFKAKIKKAAEAEGINLRRYILKAIEEKMQKEA